MDVLNEMYKISVSYLLCVVLISGINGGFFTSSKIENTSLLMPEPLFSLDSISMGEVMLHVTKHYIKPRTSTLVIMQRCIDCPRKPHYYQSNLVEYVLSKVNATMKLQLFFATDADKPWEYNIFVVDSSRAFLQLRLQIPPMLYDQQLYFFIVLNSPEGTPKKLIYYMMHRIMLVCVELNVLNMVILLQTGPETFAFFSYENKVQERCFHKQRLVKVNTWRNGSLEKNFLFPKRIHGLNGCLMKVSARVMPPMLIFNGDMKDPNHWTQLPRLSGIEGDLLKILARNLHFRIQLRIVEEDSAIRTNENSSGVFKQLQDGDADIALGGFERSYKNFQAFSASLPYYQNPKVFIVRSSLTFGPLKQLANPFDGYVWLMIALTVMVAVISIKSVLFFCNEHVSSFVIGRGNRSHITNLLSMLLGNPITGIPRRDFARFLILLWLLVTLLLRNAYQCKMFDALRISRREPLPRTIVELIERDYLLLATNYVDYYPRNMTAITSNISLRYELATRANFITTISLLDTLAYYNYHHWNFSCLTYINEPVYTFQMVMFFRKHSILRQAFDNHIKLLVDAGITSYLAEKHVKSEYRNMNEGSKLVPKISNEMLIGLYSIYGALNFVSFLILCLEIRAHRSPRLSSILDWIHYN